MPKISSEQKVRRKERILQAALACAVRKGFHQTSMRDICREANLSIGAVYNYYRSKEEILAALTRQGRQAKKGMLESLKDRRSAKESFQELFRSIFLVYKDRSFRTYGSIDLETYCEAMRNKDVRKVMREEYRALANSLVDLIRHWQKSREVRGDVDPRGLADFLISLTVGIKIHLLVYRESTPDRFEKIVQQSFFGSIWPELGPGQDD